MTATATPLVPPRAIPRVLFAAPSSGTGKTTVVCGILEALSRRGLAPASFKCGPDYIDPMFHRRIVGAKSGNLDLYFTGEDDARRLLVRGAEGAGIAVMEGVMGFYDGRTATSDEGSSYHLARATNTPVVLVVAMRGASLSIAAQIAGFARFRADANVQGVILNRCSKALAEKLRGAIERETGVTVLGYVPADARFAVESRHLGLVTAGEIADLRERIGDLADTLEETVDLDALVALASGAPALADAPYHTPRILESPARIAVARDEAFCFYYAENLRMLADLGAELAYFSPLEDRTLPEGASALYLGGGYPELHAARLAANERMREAVAHAVSTGMPTIAECGGFMYLQRTLSDDAGTPHAMAGALEGASENTGRLSHFGYLEMEAHRDCLYGPAGTRVRAHEFHDWHSTHEGGDFTAVKPSGERWPCMVATDTLVAGYPHVYFPANPCLAERFVRAAARFAETL